MNADCGGGRLPPPSALGLPESFSQWYPGQDEALSWLLDRSQGHQVDGDDLGSRFLALSAPTGSGKSVLAVLTGILSGYRTVILTATKGLQDQYRAAFRGVEGLVDIRGANAYICTLSPDVSCDEGSCRVGIPCNYKDGKGCPYQEALIRARSETSKVIITNYACWLAQNEYSAGLGDFDLLVLDEAHEALDRLADFLAVTIGNEEPAMIGAGALPETDVVEEWASWANRNITRCEDRLAEAKEEVLSRRSNGQPTGAISRLARHLAGLLIRLKALSGVQGEWIVSRGPQTKIAPVWPAEYKAVLFHGVDHVALMSATLTTKTLSLLGLGKQAYSYSFYAMPSTFPIQNRLVTHIPTVRMNRNSADLALWSARIDQIIAQRQDRKGIIHTTSYKRRDELLARSRFRGIMFSHGSRDIARAVQKFKSAPAPAILVSPSVSEGWDFPAEECEYVIVGKVPYPDMRDPVLEARRQRDKDWPAYQAMQILVQASGRGVRSQNDTCEILIIDDDWKWFWARYKDFAPSWFQEAVRWGNLVPEPPLRIERA